MTDRQQLPYTRRIAGNKLTLLLAIGSLLTTSSCALFPQNEEEQLTDDAVRQYVDEWRQIKPSIERLAALEGDLSFLLAEVSKMSDLTQTPGLALPDDFVTSGSDGIAVPHTEPLQILDATEQSQNVDGTSGTSAANDTSKNPDAAAGAEEPTARAGDTASTGLANNAEANSTEANSTEASSTEANSTEANSTEAATPEPSCPTQYADNLRKSLALSHFPRTQPATSNAGYLHQVDEHLPMLLSANLKTRHGIQVQTQIPRTLYGARHQGEHAAAAQAKAIARQHKSQFLITGEIHDMSLVSPEVAYARGPYNYLAKSVTNLINRNGLNTQSRVFQFQLQVRDGFTGQLIFDETYQTMGNWDAIRPSHIGFGSARFWQTDYGQNVQHLVAHASDKLASTLACQPFTAHADISPGSGQIVVHGGANNGFQTGDSLAVYRIMQHSIPGQYLHNYSSMVGTDANVSLVSVYPSHSIAQSNQELPETGSFLVMEP